MKIRVWSVAFSFISGVFANLFQSVNRQVVLIWTLGSAAVLKVVLNFALIPGNSYTGASIATLASSFAVMALSFIWVSKIGYGMSIKNTVWIIARVCIASAIMCVFIFYLQYFYILALVPLAALLYVVVLYIIGSIDSEDRTLLRQIISRRIAKNFNK